MKKIIDYLNKVNDKIYEQKEIYGYSEKILTLFRGENKDYKDTQLKPSIAREKISVEEEMNIYDLISDYLIEESENKLKKAITAQHYGLPSRLLDVTFNVLIALYFACYSKEVSNADGIVFVFWFPKSFSASSEYLNKYFKDLISGEKNNYIYSGNIKVINGSYSNRRIEKQNGGFILFPSDYSDFFPIPKVFYEEIKIPSEDKNEILNELDKYFDINEATLFPEKDKKTQLIKRKAKELDYTTEKNEDKEKVKDKEMYDYLDILYYEINYMRKKEGRKDTEIKRYLRYRGNHLINAICNQTDINRKKEIEKRLKAIGG